MKSGSVGHHGGLSVGNRPSAPTSQLTQQGILSPCPVFLLILTACIGCVQLPVCKRLALFLSSGSQVDFDPLCLCAAPRMQEAVEPELSAVRRLIQEEESPRRPESDTRLSDTVSPGWWEVIHWEVTGALG